MDNESGGLLADSKVAWMGGRKTFEKVASTTARTAPATAAMLASTQADQ